MSRAFRVHEELEAAVSNAEEAWRTGRWRDALRLYCDIYLQRAGDLAETASPLTPADLTILERITDLAVPFALVGEARGLLLQIGDEYRRLGDRLWADRMAIKCIHLDLNELQLDLATERLRKLCASHELTPASIECWQCSYPVSAAATDVQELFAQVWLERGRLSHLLGQHRVAQACFDRGQSLADISNGVRVSLALGAIRCLIGLGALDAARDRLRMLAPRLNRSQQPSGATAWHELSAKIHLLHGDMGAAQQDLRAVWEICCSFGFVGPLLRAATNVAQVLLVVNHTVEARQILERILAISPDHDVGGVATQAQRLLDVVNARFDTGVDRPAAVHDLQTASVVRVETPDPALLSPSPRVHGYTLDHFEDRALPCQFYLRRGDWIAAGKSLDRLLPFDQTDSIIVKKRLAAIKAMLRFHVGDDLSQARQELRVVRDDLRALGLKPECWQVQVLLSRATDDAEARQQLQEESDRLLEEIGQTLPLPERVSYLLDKSTQMDEAIGLRVRRILALGADLGVAPWWRGLSRRLRQWRAINELLDAAYWQRKAHNAGLLDRPGDRDHDIPRVPLWRRLVWTSPLEATVAFLALPDSTVVVRQQWLSLSLHVSTVGRHELREQIRQWHQSIPQADPEARDATLRRLATSMQLNTSIASLPFYVRRLRVLPDDALYGLPFAAIELPAAKHPTRRYWSDRFSLSIAFQPERRRASRPARRQPLLVGVSRARGPLPPLPGTPGQIAWLSERLTSRGLRPMTLDDTNATVDRVRQMLPDASLLHVSCHGTFVQGAPERTGLVLSGPAEDATLSMMRVARLDLRHLQHATLVACWAANDFVLPGRWILSLPEAFWRAGTGTILAPLWEVDDESTRTFVERFYAQRATHRPDVALARVQRQMRAGRGSEREAVNWAAFQLYGDPRRLRL